MINNLFSCSKYYRTGHIDMQKARFLEHERRFAAERRIKYRGTASVNLEVLHFACEKDEGNIARLRNYSICKYGVSGSIRCLACYSFYYKAIPPN